MPLNVHIVYMASKGPSDKSWSAVWRSSIAKLRSSSVRTLSLSSLIRRLDPNRFNGMDRWMVKGVKKRIGSAMSVMLYDMVRYAERLTGFAHCHSTAEDSCVDTHSQSSWFTAVCNMLI